MSQEGNTPTNVRGMSEELTLARIMDEEVQHSIQIADEDIRPLPVNADIYSTTDTDYLNGGSKPVEAAPHDLLLFPPKLPHPVSSFIAEVGWRGKVLAINGATFTAKLVPIRSQESIKEAEVYVRDVLEQDRELIQTGAIFYWSIGYLDTPSGRTKASIIRFRRSPIWSERDIDIGRHQVGRYKDLLDVE